MASKRLHEYVPHRYTPRNVNIVHKEEHQNAGFNQKFAVSITKLTGTMYAAYIFALLALLGFPFLAQWLGSEVAIYVTWISQTFIQLTMLPILSVGQNVLGRKAELQADEMFETTQKSFHDIEQIMIHLSKQDEELLKQTNYLIQILEQKNVTKK